jgi:hypothetical protein
MVPAHFEPSPSHAFRYRAYGLAVESTFELPELDADPVDPQLAGSVRIHLVAERFPLPPPSEPSDPFPPEVVVLSDDRVGFRISRGQTIEVWESDPSTREFTRGLLLGIAFTVALYQRGAWPLHVSAVADASGAWLFGGRSGAGKSTLAAWLHAQRGMPLLTDDAGVVDLADHDVYFRSASRAVRLLPDSLPHTFDVAGPTAGLARPIPSIDRKVRVRLNSPGPADGLPVRGLVMLEDSQPGEPPRIERLRGAAAIQAVRTSIFRPWLGQYMCSASDALRFCARFQARVPIYAFARQRDFGDMPAQIAPLVAMFAD